MNISSQLRDFRGNYWAKHGFEPSFWPIDEQENLELQEQCSGLGIYSDTRFDQVPVVTTFQGLGFWIVPYGPGTRMEVLGWPIPMPAEIEILDKLFAGGPFTARSIRRDYDMSEETEVEFLGAPPGDDMRAEAIIPRLRFRTEFATRHIRRTGFPPRHMQRSHREHRPDILEYQRRIAGWLDDFSIPAQALTPLPDAQDARCHLCHGSGIQTEGAVSGLRYRVACDCRLGRQDSNLCVILNPKATNRTCSTHRRRGNTGGQSRNARNENKTMPVAEVMAALHC